MLAARQLGESTEQGVCIPPRGSMVLVAHQRGICAFLLLQWLIKLLLLMLLILTLLLGLLPL